MVAVERCALRVPKYFSRFHLYRAAFHHVLYLFLVVICSASGFAQSGGTIQGTVSAGDAEHPLHSATVLLVPTGRTVRTDALGKYVISNLSPGDYTVVVHGPGLADQRQDVTLAAGATATADFVLKPAAIHEEITVTATGTRLTTFEAILPTTSLDSIEVVQRAAPALGEALSNEPGVSVRGLGPGSSRPVIRGFSGDRVLVMQDGISTGSLASQSGDHGETVDVLNLERVEIVRGPATLLYGSNAIGGVVNAISGHYDQDQNHHEGWSGSLSGLGGQANAYGGGSGSLKYAFKHWRLWGEANGQRTGDYGTPIGIVPNSRTHSHGVSGGFGWTSTRGFFDLGYQYDNREYGIPFAAFLESGGTEGGFADPGAEITNLRLKTHDFRFGGGFRELNGFISSLRATLNFTRYRHGEFEGEVQGTRFKNDQFNYRVVVDQKRNGPLSGSFGMSGIQRSFSSLGEEALAPPTDQTSFSVFGLESLEFRRIALQFGGRFEHGSYTTDKQFLPPRPDRSFNGASAALGMRIPLWKGGAFVANYTHSFRVPALEELYNLGPHLGNLSFEIGNSELKPESGDGIDLSLRHQSSRFRADVSFFNYALRNYVFLAPTGNIREGLFEAEYLQAGTHYYGGEATLEAGLTENLWLLASVDGVSARLTERVGSLSTTSAIPAGTSLPRIPPVRGCVGVDWRYKGFGLHPEVVVASAQNNLYVNETRTPGYTLVNLGASYTLARTHMVHVFSVNSFNLGDRLYRNHVSFIKQLTPEIGRGVRFSYTMRYF